MNVMRALMEMKHLGSTLRATVYAPSPQVLGLTEHSAQHENRWRACVREYSVYMMGWDPGGGSAM